MKLLIVQISDIHLRGETESVREHLLMIVDAVQHEERDLSAVVIVASGDVAWSGDKHQFDVAACYFNELRNKFLFTLPDVPVHWVVVPGNHDCDFSSESKSRNLNIQGVRSGGFEEVDDTVVETCTVPQKNFFSFTKNLHGHLPVTTTDKLYFPCRLKTSEGEVLFHCFNTAWLSERRELLGGLLFPIERIKLRDGSDYSISVFHHPYNWMPPNNHRRFREVVEAASDLLLTGHEHDGDYYSKSQLQSIPSTFLEGTVFHDHSGGEACGFNAVWVDLTTQQQRVASFALGKKCFHPTYHTNGFVSFSRGGRAGRDFTLADDFAHVLEDPGAGFLHPARGRLTLSDIYILPNFRERKYDVKGSAGRPHIRGKDFLTRLINLDRKSLILAHQHSGKSALAKVIFRHAYDSHLTPVLIEGDDISGPPDIKKFEKLVVNAMTRQYRDPELPYFAQLDSERVLIIIDNFDHSRKLSSKGRTELLNQLNSRYKRLCILGDDSLGLEELATGQLGKGALSEFSFFDLDDFGNKLRYNLIEKWYMIGVEYTVDEHEIRNKVERAAQLISGLLGKSYLPSIPIIILTFLQSLDSESPISSSAGTYGSLYEVLITQELVKIRSLKFNLDLRRTYLSEVAFWMFIHNKTVISDLEWSEFHVSYAREYHSATEKNELRDDVINLGLIKKSDESFSFNYSAQYYYFVALYFENNLHKRAEVKGIIKGLFENFHREEHSSVWLFLTHLSKDPFIVDSVVEHAKSLFSSLPTASFGAEMSVFDEIYKSVPQIVLEDIGYRERNERRFEQMDRHEEMENNDSVKDLDDNCKENEQVRQLLSSIKTLDVLGQLIKNFHGSLRGVEKFKLVKETYDLGLRTIQALLAEVAENSDVLLKEIVELIRKKHPELVIRGEIEEKVKSAVFFWVELGCFGLVKRISQAVGHAALEETYREVGFSNDSNAYSLIQLSVQLDSKGAPMNELDHWAGAFKNNAFCERLTKMLFRNHLYIFSIPEIKRQRICSKLGIEMRPASTNDMLLPGGKRI